MVMVEHTTPDGSGVEQIGTMYETRIVENLADFEIICDAWQDLHKQAGSGPFTDADWILAWGRVFWDSTVAARIATVWQGDTLIAAMPLRLVHAVVSPRLKIKTSTLQMLHDDRVGFHDVMIRPGHEDPGAEALVDLFEQTGARYLDLTPIRPSRGYDALRKALQGFWSHERVEIVTAIADLSKGWTEYLATRSANSRKSIRSVKRKIEAGSFDFSVVSSGADDAAVRAQFDAIFEISRKSWKAVRGTDVGSQSQNRKFISTLFDHLGARTTARLCVLSIDGAPVAHSIILSTDGVGYGLITDYVEAFERSGVGRYVFAEELRVSIEHGERSQDFLRQTSFTKTFSDSEADLMRLRVALRPGPARWVISSDFAVRALMETIFGAKKRLTGRRKFFGERN